MIVLDASVIIDSLLPKLGTRSEQASEVLKIIKSQDIKIHAPRIIKIELASVLSRKKSLELIKRLVEELTEEIELINEEELFGEAYNLAYKTKSRAVDLYYIAAAKLTSSILLTNDRIMVENARKAGIEAYYLLEEFEKVKKRLQ